jgi:transposase-like protein
VLPVELANRESRSSWRDFLLGLKRRGLHGVEFVVADALLTSFPNMRTRSQRCLARRSLFSA